MIDPWLDLVHGGRCVGCARRGRSLCRDCRALLPTTGHEVAPTPRPAGLAPCFAAAAYDGLVRALVLAHKEHAVHDLCDPLARCLAASLAPVTAPVTAPVRGPVPGPATLLVPVPSPLRTVRARGHDPLLRVARRSTRYAPGTQVVRLLAQVGSVADQAGLDAAGRGRNRARTMTVRESVRRRLARRPDPVSLVVVDDVLTTGSTAREAQRALEDAGLPVRAVCVVAATRRRHPGGGRPSRGLAAPTTVGT